MEVEKKSSKGGFLHLFDWNVKSRKKLFSNKTELHAEGLKQGREIFDSLAMARHQQMRTHENGHGSSVGGSDYNFASSMRNDEGFGTKAPGVVARLMGLDSLPTSNVSDPHFTPFSDSHSFRDSRPPNCTTNSQIEHHIAEYVNMKTKLDGFSRNLPIERFQTEVLPPKSARSISITHHRMLSPIKSPGFILTRNAASVMEAAAKIIDQSPRSTTNDNLPFGSSSVPLRIRDLKEKMEASQRTSKLSKTPQRPKDHRRDESQPFNAYVDKKKDEFSSLKSKGKAVSLATQAQANVGRREGLGSSSNRNLRKKEDNEVKVGPINKKQQNAQKSGHKRISTGRTSDVLRQNNQKQNRTSNKEKRSLSTNDSFKTNKTLSKVVENSVTRTRRTNSKTNSVTDDTRNEISSSDLKNLSAKKRGVDLDAHFNQGWVDDVLSNKSERSVKYNVSTDGDVHFNESGMDVVSFTFTSPIKNSVRGTNTSGDFVQVYDDRTDSKTSKSSPLGLNVIGGDALGLLLEEKLKELSCKFESTHCNLVKTRFSSSSISTSQNLLPSVDVVNTMYTEDDKGDQLGQHKNRSVIQNDSECFSVDKLFFKAKQKLQESEDVEEHSSSSNDVYGKELDCPYSSPICITSEDKISFSSNDGNQYLSAGVHERELSDSASSRSVADMGRKDDDTKSSEWELQYVRDVLTNAELMFGDFALGRAHKIITPALFDQLENWKIGSDDNVDHFKLLRSKVLFDCLSECVEFSCQRLIGGGCKGWVKWEKLLQMKELFANNLYKEICSWRSMGDLMVDELVDKDMSSQHGKWVNFEIEEFEESVEIEKGILTSLVDEVVDDLLLL